MYDRKHTSIKSIIILTNGHQWNILNIRQQIVNTNKTKNKIFMFILITI